MSNKRSNGLNLQKNLSVESTNTEPGAVATGSWTQRKTPNGVKSVARPSPLSVDPVATAPGSVFVDPLKDVVLAYSYLSEFVVLYFREKSLVADA